MPNKSLPKLIAVVGPTASGKTDLAIALAKKFRGEIVSADSRQLYRGLEIGADIIAGKRESRGAGKRRVYMARGVPHHLIACLPPSKAITMVEYKAKAIKIIRGILKRGRVPILAGGTGLYIRAIVDNFDVPKVAPDPRFRKSLEASSTAALYAKLRKLDPVYARAISPQNRRYLTRALEVIKATGRPFSEQQTQGEPMFDVIQIGIKRPRAQMYARINKRVDEMMRRGLLDEAKKLGRRYGWELAPMTSLGHRQLGEFLAGKMTLEAAVERIKRDTRRYAKRQIAWFKRDSRIVWVKDTRDAVKAVKRFFGG